MERYKKKRREGKEGLRLKFFCYLVLGLMELGSFNKMDVGLMDA